MRSSVLILSLALLLCLQASAQDSLAGVWTNPTIQAKTDSLCCVPNSIAIQTSDSGYTATYSFSSIWPNPNVQCLFLFSSSDENNLNVTKKGNSTEYGASIALSSNTFVEPFRYRMVNGSKLDIYNSIINGNNAGAVCNFTMNTFQPAPVVSTNETLVGKWVTPQVQIQTDAACCVPDSIVIGELSSGYNATYFFSANNSQCSALFTASTQNALTVAKNPSGGEYAASLVLYDTVFIDSFRYKLNNASELRIHNAPMNSLAAGEVCQFTMNLEVQPQPEPEPEPEPPVEITLPVGTWTSSTIRVQSDPYCCVPQSLTITESASGYRATYFIPTLIIINTQCRNLFGLMGTGIVDMTTVAGDDYYEGLALSTTTSGVSFRYKMSNDSKLIINNAPKNGNGAGTVCDFTFNNFQPAN